jgi:hypothetical protein
MFRVRCSVTQQQTCHEHTFKCANAASSGEKLHPCPPRDLTNNTYSPGVRYMQNAKVFTFPGSAVVPRFNNSGGSSQMRLSDAAGTLTSQL